MTEGAALLHLDEVLEEEGAVGGQTRSRPSIPPTCAAAAVEEGVYCMVYILWTCLLSIYDILFIVFSRTESGRRGHLPCFICMIS
jgi:hypothetical protein